MAVINGTVAFANLTEHEQYQGTSTGKFSIVLTLEDADAEQLKLEGVKVREYKNQAQRKFATKFEDFPIVDLEGETLSRGFLSSSHTWDAVSAGAVMLSLLIPTVMGFVLTAKPILRR